jgi:hypothetical protein
MNRKQNVFVAAALLSSAGFANAAPAIYQDGALTIPNGAIITEHREDYFTNIVLSTDSQGRLSIVAATRATPAFVEDVEAVVEENTVTLEVAGFLSTPCNALLEPAVAETDDGFVVLLAQSPSTATCAQVTQPFSTDVEIDVSDLDAGSYEVRVNDLELTFELP